MNISSIVRSFLIAIFFSQISICSEHNNIPQLSLEQRAIFAQEINDAKKELDQLQQNLSTIESRLQTQKLKQNQCDRLKKKVQQIAYEISCIDYKDHHNQNTSSSNSSTIIKSNNIICSRRNDDWRWEDDF